MAQRSAPPGRPAAGPKPWPHILLYGSVLCFGTQAKFAVVVAGILHDECGFPIEFRGKRKGQAALGYVLLVFGRVEGKTHLIYCYSNNCALSGMESPMATAALRPQRERLCFAISI